MSKVWHHPANRHNKVQAICRAISWQIRLRISRKPVIYRWVEPVKLALKRGYHSLTAQVYFQYSEYSEMHFLLDHLKEDDLFVDVGANMGAYSLLVAGVTKASVIALEPLPDNFIVLQEQLKLNDLENRVKVLPVAVGEADDTLHIFS